MILKERSASIVLDLFYPTFYTCDNVLGLLRVRCTLVIYRRTDTVIGYKEAWMERLLFSFNLCTNMLVVIHGLYDHRYSNGGKLSITD